MSDVFSVVGRKPETGYHGIHDRIGLNGTDVDALRTGLDGPEDKIRSLGYHKNNRSHRRLLYDFQKLIGTSRMQFLRQPNYQDTIFRLINL